MRQTLPALLTFILMACSSAGTPVPDSPPNPYAKNYISRMTAPESRSGAAPKIYRGQDRETDYQTMLEDGYDMLGYSSFEAGNVPPEMLTAQAVKLHADLALVYTERSGEVPASVKLDQAKSRSEKINPDATPGKLQNFDREFYHYFASYWIKLPMPLLGVHVQRDSKAEATVSGLDVIAVIKGSPAAAAGLQKGDTLLRLGEMELRKPEVLAQAAQRYAGQSAEIVFNRMGGEQRKTVTLNSPQ